MGLLVSRSQTLPLFDFGCETDRRNIVSRPLLPIGREATIPVENEILSTFRIRRVHARRGNGSPRRRRIRRVRFVIRIAREVAAEGGDAEAEAGRQRGRTEEVERRIVVRHWISS